MNFTKDLNHTPYSGDLYQAALLKFMNSASQLIKNEICIIMTKVGLCFSTVRLIDVDHNSQRYGLLIIEVD